MEGSVKSIMEGPSVSAYKSPISEESLNIYRFDQALVIALQKKG